MRSVDINSIKNKFKDRYSKVGSELPKSLFDWGEFKDEAGHDFCYSRNLKESSIDICAIHRLSDDYAERFTNENVEVDLVHHIINPDTKDPNSTIQSIYRIFHIEFNFKFNNEFQKLIPSNDFHFFWSNDSPFSQWHKMDFELNGIKYSSAEQFMMAKKAELFGDEEIKEKILATNNVRKQKELGRKVKHFDEKVWDEYKIKIVYIGNKLKFTQNKVLREQLKSTSNKLLVEASPYDAIWGIGLPEEDPKAKNQSEWKGQNLLGNVLTILRDDIINIEKNTLHNMQ